MDAIYIPQDDPRYPASLKTCLNGRAPASLTAIGDLDLLRRRTLGLFCSMKCPGGLILRAHDLAQDLRRPDLTVLSGFHTPVEREMLETFLRGRQPVIVCPARSVEGMRIRKEYLEPLRENRLLLLSPFPEKRRRIDASASIVRNRVVAALADAVLVVHAEPGGKAEQVCREALAWRKPLYALEDDANAHLIALGAKPIDCGDVNAL